jgi:hypothetical protein
MVVFETSNLSQAREKDKRKILPDFADEFQIGDSYFYRSTHDADTGTNLLLLLKLKLR